MIRRAYVAGTFYPSDAKELRSLIEHCFTHEKFGCGLPKAEEKKNVLGVVVPHAGYIYSGYVAAHAYKELAESGKPETIIILGPNHTGYGSGVAIMSEGVWETPLGEIEIDSKLANTIFNNAEIIDIDELAHMYEHSIEVQLPFLQYIFNDFKIVPICMMLQDMETSYEVGKAITEACKDKNVRIVASSDFTHYESRESAKKKDSLAIEKIEKIDAEGFYKVINEKNISVCGPGPIMSLIFAAKELGVNNAKLLKYMTSGDVTGDKSAVVGYAAVAFYK